MTETSSSPTTSEYELDDDRVLWRRIPPHHFGVGDARPSSAAFEDHPNGSPMSVTASGCGASIDDALRGHDGFALFGFTVRQARELGWRIGPAADIETNPGHYEVAGPKTRSKRRSIAKVGNRVVPPSSA